MPPLHTGGNTTEHLVKARLDASLQLLSSAVSLGYDNAAHMRTDVDFRALRELRGEKFEAIAKAAEANKL